MSHVSGNNKQNDEKTTLAHTNIGALLLRFQRTTRHPGTRLADGGAGEWTCNRSDQPTGSIERAVTLPPRPRHCNCRRSLWRDDEGVLVLAAAEQRVPPVDQVVAGQRAIRGEPLAGQVEAALVDGPAIYPPSAAE
jgi:hypothetical protein